MEDFKLKVKRLTGWSDEIVNAIRSEAEARIYMDAGLKDVVVNGRHALVQPDINPDYLMPEWLIRINGENWRGWSNSDLMGEGYPPHDRNGDPYELHHIGQLADSPRRNLRGNSTMIRATMLSFTRWMIILTLIEVFSNARRPRTGWHAARPDSNRRNENV